MTSSVAERQTRQLADELSVMKIRLLQLEQAERAAQLGNSSVEGGGLTFFDPTGAARLRLGDLGNGAFNIQSVNNPNPPPVPAAPLVEPGLSTIKVSANGFEGGAAQPGDFSRFNVYVQPAGGTATVDGTIVHDAPWFVSTTGFGVHTVWLTAVNLSGKESDASAPVEVSPGRVVSQAIEDGAITTLQLAAGAVTAANLAAGAITAAPFLDGSITLAKLADGSVDASKLVPGAVTTPAVSFGAIGANQIAANAIVAGKVAANAITGENIVAGGIQAINLAVNAVAAGSIAADTITGREIVALSITGLEIATNAITAGHIEAGSITAAKLAAQIVLAGTRIVAGSLTGNRVEIHYASGIEAWADAGRLRTFWLDASTGNCSMVGTVQAGVGNDRVIIQPNTGTGVPEILWYATGTPPAYMNAVPVPIIDNGGAGVGLGMNSGPRGITNRQTTLLLRPDRAHFAYTEIGSGRPTDGGGIYLDGTSVEMQTYNRDGSVRAFWAVRQGETESSQIVRAPSFTSGGAAHLWKTGGTGPVYMNWTGSVLQFWEQQTGILLKTFIINHPTPGLTDSHYLVHSVTESPQNGVEYWGSARVGYAGMTVVLLPSYFEDLVEELGRSVQLTVAHPDGKWLDVPRVSASYPRGGKFSIHADGAEPVHVFWLVKGTRKDVPPLNVEPRKDSVVVGGTAPYRYIAAVK